MDAKAPVGFNTMNEIRLLVMPYELGRLRDGVGRGPERLLQMGAQEVLAARGAEVQKVVIELEREHDNEIDASFELIELVAAGVREAVRDGAFPVLLSGSCFAAVGVVAGLGEEAPGVVWFDAHGDFNTPETSIYGYFDGMGLAVLTGSAWQTMHSRVDGAMPVPETAVVLAGARDLDPPEVPRLEASAITHLRPESMRSPQALMRAVDALTPSPSGLYAHIDLDVLDVDEARVNRYSAPGGVTAAELESLLEALLAAGGVRVVSLTAYEPAVDTAAAVPPIANRLLEVVAGRLTAPGA
jgi:arginase